jgi:epoxyqueuosine reductase
MTDGAITPPITNKERIVAEARRLGFDQVAIARADLPLDTDYARYEAFVDEGMHGSMAWLAASREARRRVDDDHILAGAKSVICVAQRYGRTAEEEAHDPLLAQSIARYARGRDYHNGLRKKLRKLARLVRTLGTTEQPVEARPMCDDAPILERAWAARAGLGFVGKNGLLIVPGVGSLLLLGEVVTTLELEPDPPIPERCGACTRCLDACPTKAFAKPFVLDARKCVAYLTIELRDAVPEPLREGIGEHLFGCDECQTVCPFNARSRATTGAVPVDARFAAHPRWEKTSLHDLVALDETTYATLREGTPVARATRIGLARNAAIAMGNRADPADLEVLERARNGHDAEVVREAAAWAIARIRACEGAPKG